MTAVLDEPEVRGKSERKARQRPAKSQGRVSKLLRDAGTGFITVVVEGEAGAGKSSIAKLLARETGYLHFNAGMPYRWMAYMATRAGIQLRGETGKPLDLEPHRRQLNSLFTKAAFEFVLQSDGTTVLKIEGTVLEEGSELYNALRQDWVSQAAAVIGAYAPIAKRMVKLARKTARSNNMIYDGRAGSTLVFPHTPWQVYVFAEYDVRVKRRMKDHKPLPDVKLQIDELRRRDEEDRCRPYASSVPGPHVIPVDTTHCPTPQDGLVMVLKMLHFQSLRKGLVQMQGVWSEILQQKGIEF
jgi:cytidylate kinase